MIVKQANPRPDHADPKRRAGVEAERQMAFYLNREFAATERLLVLNDLRLVDPAQPEHDGRPGVCQIDHLILHKWGAFIIESKSVTGEVSVRDDGGAATSGLGVPGASAAGGSRASRPRSGRRLDRGSF